MRAFAVSLLLAGGCFDVHAYHCNSNLECINSDTQGICEPTGACSFPDATCPSHQRYGAGSPNPVANTCTPVDGDCIVEILGGGTTENNLDVGHTCVRKTDGTVWCWGDNSFGQLGQDVGATSAAPVQVGLPAGTSAAKLSSGEVFVCALTTNGTVYCWGDNSQDQLGQGPDPATSSTPLLVSGAPPAKAVGAGGAHACVVSSDGSVGCWGENGNLQIAGNATDPQPTPLFVTGVAHAVAVGAGDQHTCALLEDTSVRCWGSNALGQLGQGDNSAQQFDMPVTVMGLLSASAIRLGDQHTCALLNDTSLLCWGTNVSGTVGNGSTMNANLPVQILDGVTSVGTSGDGKHTCAAKLDGTLWCWGNNDSGQVGLDPDQTVKSPVPVRLALSSVKLVGTGAHHSCAVTFDGAVWCWGSNHSGQLGLADGMDRITPTRTPFTCH